ncbi:MAG: hypothetical protein WCP29_09935 [Acidobacteriota bacterium]
MPTLKKATLQEIKADASAAPIGAEIEVQFNPASLTLELANRVEGGDTRGRQNRQYLGKTSTTLSFDLHFDTADLGTPDAPVSVRTLTAQVERFVLPKGEGNTKQAPPKCRFHWDELVIDGIIESVSIDFDLFASNGTPLRAKLGVSIKEQDAKYELLQSGPGANQAAGATAPGAASTAPGRGGGPPADRSADALAGESVADFAARMGLDPSAWRGIAASTSLGASSSLSLQAGRSIDFSSALSAGAGVSTAVGVDAGVSLSLGGAFGIDPTVARGANVAATPAAAGFALSASGGLGAAIETVASVKAANAASDARRSFGPAVPSAAPTALLAAVPSPSSTPRPSRPDQTRTPLALSGLPTPGAQAAAPAAPAPPLADTRASSFGFGVPLRPRVSGAADLRASTVAGRVPLRPRGPDAGILPSTDPSTPPWTRLPPDAVQRAADQAQARRRPERPCGCQGRCRHGAGSCP